jgi:type II secretory pathway component PulL
MFAANRAGMGIIGGRGAREDGVTHMWLDVAIVALFIVGIYCFAVLTGWQTRLISRRTKRRAEDMYDQYADSPHRQRRYDKQHGETRQDDPAGPGSRR